MQVIAGMKYKFNEPAIIIFKTTEIQKAGEALYIYISITLNFINNVLISEFCSSDDGHATNNLWYTV